MRAASGEKYDCHLCACARFPAPGIEYLNDGNGIGLKKVCSRSCARLRQITRLPRGERDCWIEAAGSGRGTPAPPNSRSVRCQRACRPPLRSNHEPKVMSHIWGLVSMNYTQIHCRQTFGKGCRLRVSSNPAWHANFMVLRRQLNALSRNSAKA